MILPLYSLVNIDSFVRRGVPDSLSLREGSIMIQSWTQEAKELQLNHLAFSLYLKILQPFLSLTLIGFCDEIRRGEVLHLPIWLFLRSKFLSTQPNTFQHFSLNPTSHAHWLSFLNCFFIPLLQFLFLFAQKDKFCHTFIAFSVAFHIAAQISLCSPATIHLFTTWKSFRFIPQTSYQFKSKC